MMRAEQIKNVLSAVAIDFIEGAARQREIYLYPEDVVADDIATLNPELVIKVTFTYDIKPKSDII